MSNITSGSIWGSHIVRELIREDKPVIAFVVGGLESVRSAKNTKNTLATLDNLATNTLSAPIVMHYRCNQDSSLSDVDRNMCHALGLVELVAAREARSLDGADIRNWLHYTKVTGVSPRLSSLEVYVDDSASQLVKSAVSVVSLVKNHDAAAKLGVNTEYHRFGVQERFGRDDEVSDFEGLHFLIDQAPVAEIFKAVETRVDELEHSSRARPSATPKLKTGDADDQGFIMD